MQITPEIFLATLLVLTGAGWVLSMARRARRAAKLCKLAQTWQMRYVGHDPFDLAGKIAGRFEVPGAASLDVVDLIYGMEPGRHRYLFTIQYTQGAVRTKERRFRVATFSEPRDVAGGPDDVSRLHLAPAELPLLEQYSYLRQTLAGEGPGNPHATPKSSSDKP